VDERGVVPDARRVWRAAMDRFFPEAAWIRVRRDPLDRLQVFKAVTP